METDNNNEEVKEFSQTVYVTPSKDEELVEETENETQSSSSDEKNEPEPETEEEIEKETTEEETQEVEESEEEEQEAEAPIIEPKPVEGESPRERALRMETTRLKGLLRKERQEELFVKKPIDSKSQDEDLAEYDPEELKRFELLATKMGFAKKDELIRETVYEKNNNEFESFLEAHPEYSPENDTNGVLWNQFKSEFNLYQSPQDPKTLKKILNKVHNEIFGVQPAKNLNKITASQEKIKVASHTGASAGNKVNRQSQRPSGLRLDALKGFSDDDINEIFG